MNFFFLIFSPEKSKRKFHTPHQMQHQSPFSKRKSHMITQLDALKNQTRAKNASKMIKFPCDISPCNIPSVSHAIWVAAILRILRYAISHCISVRVPIVFYVPYCKAIFFCNIAYCMLHGCKIPLTWISSYMTRYKKRCQPSQKSISVLLQFWGG